MGNIFETECKTFMAQGAQKLNPPLYLIQMVDKLFRSPFNVYKAIKEIVSKHLQYSFLLEKNGFLQLAQEFFFLDPQEEGKRLYKLAI